MITKEQDTCRMKHGTRLFLKFVITAIMVVISCSMIYTNSAFGKINIGIASNSTSTHPLPSFLNSSANSSVLNVSSLSGSSLSIAKSMRNSNETTPASAAAPYIAENRKYIFSQNKTEISTPLNNSHTGEFGKAVKIAVVMPTFTAAAYTNAFYVFYNKYINVTRSVNVTTDLIYCPVKLPMSHL